MAPLRHYRVDFGWQAMCANLGIKPQDLLRHAQLPLDLFQREEPTLTAAEYFRVWQSVEAMVDDPVFPLRMAAAVSPETFSPPLFAAYCSPNLEVALERLAEYKPLIGPMTLDLTRDAEGDLVVTCAGLPEVTPLPSPLGMMEAVWKVTIARSATRVHIVPKAVELAREPRPRAAMEEFFGCRIRRGEHNRITFRAEDLRRPFLTANEGMWRVFAPELRARLAELEQGATMAERVRAVLTEGLAAGRAQMGLVARGLAVSERTLQRRLKEEGTTFQDILTDLRADLARHYLTQSRHSTAEISFLLGYSDPGSFTRAYQTWEGRTPEAARAEVRLQ